MTELNDDFEDMVLHKFENGIDLSFEEKMRLVEARDLHVSEYMIDSGGRVLDYKLIVKLKNRVFCLDYEYELLYSGLWEDEHPRDIPSYQFNRPLYEVHPVRVTETKYMPKF